LDRRIAGLLALGLVGLFLMLLSRHPAAAPLAPPPPDQERIQGTWQANRVQVGGGLMDMRVSMQFAGDRFTLLGDIPLAEADFQLDPNRTPKEITVRLQPGNFIMFGGVEGAAPKAGEAPTWAGIYKFEGDSLKVCLNLGGRERPHILDGNIGSTVFLFDLSRRPVSSQPAARGEVGPRR
jgi:uncharacterized protein (TIGR03067 family)